MRTDIQTVTLNGHRFVIIPEIKYQELLGEGNVPDLPKPDATGRYPAVESARIVLARDLIRRRQALGLTQVELAKRAKVRVETLSRLEHGKHSPNVATVDKIARALRTAERRRN